MAKISLFSADMADTLALEALTFLVQDLTLIELFCEETGIQPQDLRSRLNDRFLLGAIVDFIISDAQRLNMFSQRSGYPCEHVVKARLSLPGVSAEMRTVENF